MGGWGYGAILLLFIVSWVGARMRLEITSRNGEVSGWEKGRQAALFIPLSALQNFLRDAIVLLNYTRPTSVDITVEALVSVIACVMRYSLSVCLSVCPSVCLSVFVQDY